MIRVNHHRHARNTGLGNKLFLNFLARALSIENNEPLENWMRTKIYAGEEGNCDGINHDNWGYAWPYINSDESNTTVVGGGTNCGYGDHYHQNEKTVNIISKHKDALIKDFGKRSGVFVHVRFGDLASTRRWSTICSYEYYSSCLSDFKEGYLASDWPDHPFVQNILNDFNLKLYEATPEETIIFASTFDNKILSLGTFSWWMGFIGNQNNVMCPNPEHYSRWHGPIFECMKSWKIIDDPRRE